MNMTAESSVDTGHWYIRRLWWHEQDRFLAHLLRLSPEDRYLRFGGHITDDGVRDYVRRGDWLHHSLLGVFVDGELRAVGECRYLERRWPREAELAFSVEKPFQGRGFGTALFQRLLTFARNRAVRRVYVTTLRQNARMRRIARKFHMAIAPQEDEVEGRLELVWPSYLSLVDEALDHGRALLGAGLSQQARVAGRNGNPTAARDSVREAGKGPGS